jgi:hypothetical protein
VVDLEFAGGVGVEGVGAAVVGVDPGASGVFQDTSRDLGTDGVAALVEGHGTTAVAFAERLAAPASFAVPDFTQPRNKMRIRRKKGDIAYLVALLAAARPRARKIMQAWQEQRW